MKKIIIIAALLLAAASGKGQVLGESSTYGNNRGIGIYIGTQNTFGRSFVYQDNYTEWQVVNPEKYKTQVINPVFGLGWWSEFPKDRLVIGLQILGSYCIEKYQVTLDSESLNGNNKDISLDLNLYVGWHFSEQLMAGVGVMGENRLTAGSDWKVDIFNTHSKVGPMALVRYDFAENFYVSLQGGYSLLNLGGLNKDRDTLKPMGDNSYYAVDSKLKTLTVRLGVGTSF